MRRERTGRGKEVQEERKCRGGRERGKGKMRGKMGSESSREQVKGRDRRGHVEWKEKEA